jgi:hypothetical protein
MDYKLSLLLIYSAVLLAGSIALFADASAQLLRAKRRQPCGIC